VRRRVRLAPPLSPGVIKGRQKGNPVPGSITGAFLIGIVFVCSVCGLCTSSSLHLNTETRPISEVLFSSYLELQVTDKVDKPSDSDYVEVTGTFGRP
jgi:hypothetical protein